MTTFTDYYTIAFINLTTITLPLILTLWRIERRLTKLETEHTLLTKQHKKCQPN